MIDENTLVLVAQQHCGELNEMFFTTLGAINDELASEYGVNYICGVYYLPEYSSLWRNPSSRPKKIAECSNLLEVMKTTDFCWFLTRDRVVAVHVLKDGKPAPPYLIDHTEPGLPDVIKDFTPDDWCPERTPEHIHDRLKAIGIPGCLFNTELNWKRHWTNKELFEQIIKILEAKGKIPDILEWPPRIYWNEERITSPRLDCRCTLCRGYQGSYLNVHLEGWSTSIFLGTFKTLKSGRESYNTMARLLADFQWECDEFMNDHIREFTEEEF